MLDEFAVGPDGDPRPVHREGTGTGWDRSAAVALYVVMVPVVGILFVVSRFNVAVYACPQDPACNVRMMNLGSWMLNWLPLIVFLASIVITVVLWRLHRKVFWVSLLTLILIAVVFILSSLLISWAW